MAAVLRLQTEISFVILHWVRYSGIKYLVVNIKRF
tara:strand:- start:2237 stop:2341 length:105 start_codon:yes stop_codon:yes gene_type:complete